MRSNANLSFLAVKEYAFQIPDPVRKRKAEHRMLMHSMSGFIALIPISLAEENITLSDSFVK